MKLSNLALAFALLLSSASTTGTFNSDIRNGILSATNERLLSAVVSDKDFLNHLAYLTEHEKKVAVNNDEKMEKFMKTVRKEKSSLESEMTDLTAEIDNLKKSKPAYVVSFLHKKEIDEYEKNVMRKQSELEAIKSKLLIVDNFLKYCVDDKCHVIVEPNSPLVADKEIDQNKKGYVPRVKKDENDENDDDTYNLLHSRNHQ